MQDRHGFQALHLDLFPGFSRVIPIKRVFTQSGVDGRHFSNSPPGRIARLKGEREEYYENNG
jgi:hypothetical protein